MKKSRWMFVVAAAMSLVVTGFLPVWTAQDTEQNAPNKKQAVKVEAMVPTGTILPAMESCESQDDLVLDESGLIIGGRGPGCLSGGPPNNCDDYPIGYGGTCSCSQSLIQERCRECDSGKKGQVLETTCTVCPGCVGPICIPVPCNNFTSRTCSVF